MKASTKITVGLSIVAVAGIATTVLVSEKMIQKALEISNRRKVKNFVKIKLKGNEQLLGLVEHLDDDDIEKLVTVGKKMGASLNQMNAYGEEVLDVADEATSKVKKGVSAFFNK